MIAASDAELTNDEHMFIVIHQIEKEFPYPLFVKPAALGSSVGMTKVHSRQELTPALNLASEFVLGGLAQMALPGNPSLLR